MDSFGLPNLISAQIKIEIDSTDANKKSAVITEQLNASILSESIQGLFDRKEEFAKSQTILKEIESHEKNSLLISQYKNKMENYLYNMQDILEDEEKKVFLSERDFEHYSAKI